MTERERTAYLAEVCEDAGQRRRVEELLALDTELAPGTGSKDDDVFARLDSLAGMDPVPAGPAMESGARSGQLRETGVRVRLGPYELVDVLGEGGMGIVYLAEQTSPVERTVALKLVRSTLAGERAAMRFVVERQAMARLSHPNIAQIYEAGTTADGHLYFAMEYVDGQPLTAVCDARRLGLEDRLRLFVDVCRAVQHAHQRGIIHRDLKPSNIVVGEVDGRLQPKIIDFGIAKALDRPLGDSTLTGGGLVGTPSYMSPESLLQEEEAMSGGTEVDIRTDVYALGVVLYELLAGSRPFDAEGSSVGAILRRVTEGDPPRLRDRYLAHSPSDREQIAAQRQMSPATLEKSLDGDLEHIVGKAIRKSREERYESASALAADVERFLDDRPVEASPPTKLYLAKKFAKRHRAGVTTAVVGLMLLIGFVATTAAQNRRIASALDKARQESEARGLVSEFLQDLFTVSNPSESRGNTITARELLDQGAESISTSFGERPEIRAELMATMGDVYINLGLYDAAEPLLDQALAEYRGTLGKEHLDTLASANKLAVLYIRQGRFGEGETLQLESLAILRSVHGDDHPHTLDVIHNLGALHSMQGQPRDAEPYLLEALESRRRVLPEGDRDTLSTMNSLAVVYVELDRLAEAEPLYLEVLERCRRQLGDDDPFTLKAINNLGILYKNTGRYPEAERLHREALTAKRRVLGSEHPSTIRSLKNLGSAYRAQGRFEEAESAYVETLDLKRKALGPEHPSTLRAISGLASLYEEMDRLSRSEELVREHHALRTKLLGPSDPATLRTKDRLGDLLIRQGRYEEGRKLIEAASGESD